MKRDFLQVQGTTVINGVEIPNVLGGFGEGKKSLTDKTIAEIHNVEVREIRQLIKNNISRFKESIDYIDLKQINQNDVFFNLDFTKAQVGNSKNIYLLSERGYAKLIKIMDSDLAWDIHDKLIDEYFAMREIINSDEERVSI
ncbi:ORF6N domain-containing protein [Paraclostridium tenue]